MTKRPSFDEHRKKMLKDPEVKAAYDALQPEFDLIRDLLRERQKARKREAALLKRVKVQQRQIDAMRHEKKEVVPVPSRRKVPHFVDISGKPASVGLRAKKNSKKSKKKLV
jgi:hypothetical protein